MITLPKNITFYLFLIVSINVMEIMFSDNNLIIFNNWLNLVRSCKNQKYKLIARLHSERNISKMWNMRIKNTLK